MVNTLTESKHCSSDSESASNTKEDEDSASVVTALSSLDNSFADAVVKATPMIAMLHGDSRDEHSFPLLVTAIINLASPDGRLFHARTLFSEWTQQKWREAPELKAKLEGDVSGNCQHGPRKKNGVRS